MARKSYRQRLDALRERVVEMADLVVERLRTALTAIEDRDETIAREVVAADREVNELYLEIESECIDLFALQQPVAGDLRFVAASFKIVTDLERVGDLATNLAGYALEADRGLYSELDLRQIGDLTAGMIEDAVGAYERADADVCFEIDRRDDEVDTHCEQAGEVVIRDLISLTGAGIADSETKTAVADSDVRTVLDDVSLTLLTIRDLERVGDHAVNVAARTLYMVDNDDELLY